MFESLDGHALTVIPIVAMMMVAPFYTLGVYVFSGASPKKGMQIGTAFLLWGSLMFWVSLSDIPDYLGQAGTFLIEMILGHIPGVFAYPAGLGDTFVGLVALGVLLAYRKTEGIPKAGIFLVIGLGAADFLSALFFGTRE